MVLFKEWQDYADARSSAPDAQQYWNDYFLRERDFYIELLENDTITATAQNPALTLDAAWTSPDDLLYIAMGESVNYVNNQINTNQKLSDAEALLSPYATLDTLNMGLAPAGAPTAKRTPHTIMP